MFVIRRDRKKLYHFAPLNSGTGKKFLDSANLDHYGYDTIVLFENERYFDRSTAVLRIFRQLGGPWKILYAFIIIPKPLRDFFYNLLARYRYRIFGRYVVCPAPEPEWRERFLS